MVGQGLEALSESLGTSLGITVAQLRPISGGDISRAFVAELSDGRELFVKTHPKGHAMFEVEAAGLAWLAEASALRTPDVLGVGDVEGPAWLALSFVAEGPPSISHDEALGRGLAGLHRCGVDDYGWMRGNFIGSLPQDNDPAPDWPTFYGQRRLHPLARSARDRGLLGQQTSARIDELVGQLPSLCGPPEPPARLHGDLWGGNALVASDGAPVLIDPAVYAGHREVDLAMMRLFGGFSSRVFAAYEEAAPLHPGAEERIPLYQLYPLLVHVLLFGGAYVSQLDAALRRVAA